MSDITLKQLKKNMCKWPIGDPLEDDFHFCGNPSAEEHPYCSEHTQVAYKKDAGRRRK